MQLPPNWGLNLARLAAFLGAAPADYRWAVEFRDPRWLCDEVYATLQRHGAALCIHDMIPDHPRVITADWTYLRYHGDRYGGCYSPQQLSPETGRQHAEAPTWCPCAADYSSDFGLRTPASCVRPND